MTAPTTQNFFDASNWVYGYADSNLPPPIPIGLAPFLYAPGRFDSGLLASGFHGAAFLTPGPDPQVIVAFEGTDVSGIETRPSFLLAQLAADVGLYLGFVPEALRDAATFTRQVLDAAVAQGIPADRVVVTGHSLGAAEAAYVSTQTGLAGTTFAAPGLSTDLVSFGGAGALTNYVDYGDPVGNYSATPTDIEGDFLFSDAIQRVGDPTYVGDRFGADELSAAAYLYDQGDTGSGLAGFALLAAEKHPLTNYGADLNLILDDSPVLVDASRIVSGRDYGQLYGDLVDRNALVSDAYYAVTNPDVRAAGIDAEVHYGTFGWREGRDPSAFFSTQGYRAANPDVAAADVNPLAHYDAVGWREGRDPSASFDTRLYLARNPDVAAAGIDPLGHFLNVGQYEGRATAPAIGAPGDLASSGDFDAEYYLLANPDVADAALAAGGDSDAFARQHYAARGWREGRDPNAVFDVRGYLGAYADVRAAGIDPLAHYTLFGWREGRDPSASFDTRSYLAANPDVAAAGGDPLLHYLAFGIYEGRAAAGDGAFA
ncbi:hypothetical protein OPKNFCMD_2790 [Methylobacterium crusticola]|uniref:Fungal lipase-like domain-containing protein n=1 Tax=Methylobacterium crusticola TaxID=1697972 RepID=A0ABQ4QXV6_9HYPH|nr:hypothetical protein [Methylobacterium crusticola]GJD50054.1 hypothetical protein OPKNFCMD_2790 [Methylobacterium crusticola]